MEAAVIVTYRCNCRCHMCNTWKFPTEQKQEFQPGLLEKLPRLSFCNITGGEPFLREDIEDIIAMVSKKAKRVVISTNGYFTEKIVALAVHHPRIGFRISIEGLPAVNDELRGMTDGFDHGLRTILGLLRLGRRDVGFGITVSDRNFRDMLELYHLAKFMNVEFATALVHNSFYFHKYDNIIADPEAIAAHFHELIGEQLRSRRIKDWYRAYFNHGLVNLLHGRPRLLPCRAGSDGFFLDPAGEIWPCNGMEEKFWLQSMGNLQEKTFAEIWMSEQAKSVRDKVAHCQKNCWMIGTASPAIKRNPGRPTAWVIKNKFLRSLAKK
ncbi:MAG: radical SAM protein [Candidatus Aminicenantes bacterium]|nr:radical SAM protein [Candidatus Aminicenantes bacterium]